MPDVSEIWMSDVLNPALIWVLDVGNNFGIQRIFFLLDINLDMTIMKKPLRKGLFFENLPRRMLGDFSSGYALYELGKSVVYH